MIPIVCPTHGRAGKVAVLEAIDDVILCVAASQEPLYREYYDVEMLVHPDSVVGLAAKRQWIYEQCGDVFMLDDDVAALHTLTVCLGEPSRVPAKVAWQLVQRLAAEAADLGVYLFSFDPVADRRNFKPSSPFRVKGYVPGHSFGMRKGSKLFFTKESVEVEDYWISCLNAYHHRMAWVDRRYGFTQKDTFTSQGGLSAHRTMETERQDTEMLMRYFGEVITWKKGTARASPTHRYQRSMHLPF